MATHKELKMNCRPNSFVTSTGQISQLTLCATILSPCNKSSIMFSVLIRFSDVAQMFTPMCAEGITKLVRLAALLKRSLLATKRPPQYSFSYGNKWMIRNSCMLFFLNLVMCVLTTFSGFVSASRENKFKKSLLVVELGFPNALRICFSNSLHFAFLPALAISVA